jgi:hypothetical protein
MEQEIIENDSKEQYTKKNKWKKTNISCFIGSLILVQLASSIWNWLVNLDEYTIGLSMLFLFPAFVAIFCLVLMQLAIVAAVFVFMSMKNIIKEYNEKKKMWVIILGIEIILYVIYILSWFVI